MKSLELIPGFFYSLINLTYVINAIHLNFSPLVPAISLNNKVNKMNKLNILIVEDDPIHALITESFLENYFNTQSVGSGYEALEIIEKQKFDIILMDINLNNPAMDGIKTMRNIRYNRKHRHTKIIAVTASSDAREWFLKQGFDEHYMKPISGEGIIQVINKQINQPVFNGEKLSDLV